MFGKAGARLKYIQSCARSGARFVTFAECKACSTCKLLPLHIASPANHHIALGFGQRHGDGSCVGGGIDGQNVHFDVISWGKAICLPILLRISCFLISVTKL